MPPQSALITVMVNAARKASIRLKRDYGEVDQLQVSKKGPADFVTAADIRTEITGVGGTRTIEIGTGSNDMVTGITDSMTLVPESLTLPQRNLGQFRGQTQNH